MRDGLDREYLTALSHHLQEQTEGSLSRAYELGRQALATELGILDTLSLYEAAFRHLVLSAPVADQPRVAGELLNFFREMLSPFEMAFRGYREANRELLRVNVELVKDNAELQSKQLQLVQSAKMASLGELVAGVAHEINNPLAFVLSHLDTVRRKLCQLEPELPGPLSDSAREKWIRATERLDEVGPGLERIRELVIKLRTFSRLDEGERKVVDVRECVESVLMILAHRTRDRIEVEMSFGPPAALDCFPSLLNQALMNLIANAIDAIAQAGTEGKLAISGGAVGDTYVLRVVDSGCGIPEALRERVFDPFFTTKDVGQGTGLGLSITYSIIKKHGGSLQLLPADGGGTVAQIALPLAGPPSPA